MLKKSFFLLVVCILTLPSLYAQKTTTLAPVRKYDSGLIQGNWMLHVNATGSKLNSPVSGGFSNYTIAPQIGYFILNNLVVSAQVGFGIEHFYHSAHLMQKPFHRVKVSTQEIAARYYLLPFRFKPFAQVTFGGNRYQSDDKQISDVKGYKFNGTVAVGAAFFVSPRLSVEAMYNYRYSKEVLPTPSQSDGALRIGISYFIGK